MGRLKWGNTIIEDAFVGRAAFFLVLGRRNVDAQVAPRQRGTAVAAASEFSQRQEIDLQPFDGRFNGIKFDKCSTGAAVPLFFFVGGLDWFHLISLPIIAVLLLLLCIKGRRYLA